MGGVEVIGLQEITTSGDIIFHPHQCEYCQLDSGGNHSYNCPNKNLMNEIYFNDYLKNVAKSTIVGKVVFL